MNIKKKVKSFNSLQTGKWILTLAVCDYYFRFVEEFQFPSNGKVDPNHTMPVTTMIRQQGVSIPFKRESGS